MVLYRNDGSKLRKLWQMINPGSLAEELSKVLEDARLCRRLGENAYEKVKADFSVEKNMNKLLEIYRKVLEIA